MQPVKTARAVSDEIKRSQNTVDLIERYSCCEIVRRQSAITTEALKSYPEQKALK